jgi:hypothetical protein
MGTGAPLELARHQLTKHHDSSNKENMAQLNPSIFLRKRLRENDHKTRRPLNRIPAVRGGSRAQTRKAT